MKNVQKIEVGEGKKKLRGEMSMELTEKEKKIIELVGRAFSNAEIGDALGCSVNTVKNRMNTIFDKVGVDSRLQLALKFRKEENANIATIS